MPIRQFTYCGAQRCASRSSEGSPIVILASGERSGSTLVQRYLCSHPGVHIWGELGGYLDLLSELVGKVEDRCIQYADVADQFAVEGTKEFIANLSPPPLSVNVAFSAFIEALFAGTWLRWGFKEVRWSEKTVDLLGKCFAEVRFIGVIRDIYDSLGSLLNWRWSKDLCSEFCLRWMRQTSVLLNLQESSNSNALVIRYEDLLSDLDVAFVNMPEFLGLASESFNKDVFLLRIADHKTVETVVKPIARVKRPLPRWAKILATKPEVEELRQRAGYTNKLV